MAEEETPKTATTRFGMSSPILAVRDVAASLDYRTRGARVRHPPTNYPWACEMQIEDLDGNVLRLGSESKTDQPFGEWLDMRGDAWVRGADGRPQKVPRE